MIEREIKSYSFIWRLFHCFSKHKRWRPEGHSMTTPLWRLDKMIAFPYHDEASRLRGMSTGWSGKSSGKLVQRERAQMESLVMNAQGPLNGRASPEPAPFALGDGDDDGSFGGLFGMVYGALEGSATDRRR